MILALALLLGQVAVPPNPILPIVPAVAPVVDVEGCIFDPPTKAYFFVANDGTIGFGRTCKNAHDMADNTNSIQIQYLTREI